MAARTTMQFCSRRSNVFCTNGAVASSQPLASEVGLSVLKSGGNAADAAVAMAAALNVTEPCSTGIGGDMFCLFFDAKTGETHGINGSGRTPAALTMARVRADRITGPELPHTSPHTVTVPGACAGWADTVTKFGSGTKTLADLLQPAIRMAEEGVPINEICAHWWADGSHLLKTPQNPHGKDMLMPDGEAPKAGEIMKMPLLAKTFRAVAEGGVDAFYDGPIAEAIVATLKAQGGVMTTADLKGHKSSFDKPISTNYRGVDVFEIAPNGQGLTALMALNILEGFDLSKMGHNSPAYLHHCIEALRLSFSDTRWFVTDPEHSDIPLSGMLSKGYGEARRALMKSDTAVVDPVRGAPVDYSDTVYFSVVDGEGNACSFINSNFMGFGSGLVPEGCGFTLQNRAAKMELIPEHPNCLAPGKRPYHTIIPAMAVKDGKLMACFGVMGGFMQPQGHVQVIANMVDFEMSPQAALDAPRFCIGPGHTGAEGAVEMEDGISAETCETLRTSFGHEISPKSPVAGHARSVFGRGQIITRNPESGVLTAGSDPRGDGCAMGW